MSQKIAYDQLTCLLRQTVRGRWEDNDIVAKFLNVRELTKRVTRDFIEEFSRLRLLCVCKTLFG